MMKKSIIMLPILAAVISVGVSACGSSSQPDQYAEVEKKASSMQPYIPKNDVELRNYNKAQELYDDPAAIQWCTVFPSSASAPIVTTPIAGKLTTSATSYFSPTEVQRYGENQVNIPKRSVDGLFHGPSFYRYGFTPGGDYVDFSNSLEMRCTTALTEFQRQNTFVEMANTEGDVDSRQAQAEEALKSGDNQKAENILKGGK